MADGNGSSIGTILSGGDEHGAFTLTVLREDGPCGTCRQIVSTVVTRAGHTRCVRCDRVHASALSRRFGDRTTRAVRMPDGTMRHPTTEQVQVRDGEVTVDVVCWPNGDAAYDGSCDADGRYVELTGRELAQALAAATERYARGLEAEEHDEPDDGALWDDVRKGY